MLLANLPITTAVTTQKTTAVPLTNGAFNSALFEAIFTYGSGGTTVDAWVQTSLDGGATFFDVMNFHFTTASASFIFNISALTSITSEYTPTNGTLASNTCKDGLLGDRWQVLYTTTGTYAGSTSLQVYMAPRGPFGGSTS
jgi:hypothetical protein